MNYFIKLQKYFNNYSCKVCFKLCVVYYSYIEFKIIIMNNRITGSKCLLEILKSAVNK